VTEFDLGQCLITLKMEELDILIIRHGVITQNTIVCAKPLTENIKAHISYFYRHKH